MLHLCFMLADGLPFCIVSLVVTCLFILCATFSCVPLDITPPQNGLSRGIRSAEGIKTNTYPPFSSVVLFPPFMHTFHKKLNNCPFTISVSWCHGSPVPLTRFPSVHGRRACFRDPISQIAATLCISFNAFFLNGFSLSLSVRYLKATQSVEWEAALWRELWQAVRQDWLRYRENIIITGRQECSDAPTYSPVTTSP